MPFIEKDVPGFPGYMVSSEGRVWSAWKLRKRSGGGRGTESYVSEEWKEMSRGTPGKWYPSVSFRKDGEYHGFLVHRLVLMTFRGPCPEGKEGCHRNGNKWDCRLSNLYWGTREENIADSIRHGTFYNATKAAALVTKGKPRPDDVKAAISAAHKGKKFSEEHKEAIKAAHWSNGPDAAEITERMAEKLQGKKHSEEHKEKIRQAGLERWAKIRQEREGSQP